jgi:N-acetylglucosaminyl-diphospho-decaprenol L-rhamnosyltransferase
MITASIVSHAHGSMVALLVEDLLACHEIVRIVVTQNVAEAAELTLSDKVILRRNPRPKGYGANQNAAFATAVTPFFCVLNPDMRLEGNPFPGLLAGFREDRIAVIGPKILSPDGNEEDSARKFPTVGGLLAKLAGINDGTYPHANRKELFNPDWLAGMMLLVRSETFRSIGGFDEKFFLYYEDVDLCARLRMLGHEIRQERSVEAIHDARRQSRRNPRFTCWHLASMTRYLLKNYARNYSAHRASTTEQSRSKFGEGG